MGNAEKKKLSMLYNFAAKKLGYEGGNPARSADRLKENKAGYHTWTEAEIQRFLARHGGGSKARLALLLALNTGIARQDLCGAGRHMLSLRNGQLRIAYARGKTGVGADLPVFPELAIEIDALPAEQRIFLTKSGSQEPYKVTSFGNWFKDRCAEAGATENEIASYLAHTDTSQASIYTARANRSKLADSRLEKLGILSNFPQRSDGY